MGEYARHHNYTVDLNKPLQRHFCGVLLAGGDNDGDDFIFTVKRDGEVYKPDTIPFSEGHFIRSDGVTVKLQGTHLSDDGVATVTLAKECYACEGRFTLTVKFGYYPNIETSLAIIDGFIRKTSTGTVIRPTDDEEESGGVSWATVPDYWQTHIDARVNDTNTAMAAAAGDRSAFLFYTDAHWSHSYQKGPMLLKYLCMNTPIKKVVFGGDIVFDEDSDMSYLAEWREAVSELPCHHSVPGNHDDGNNPDNRWDDAYVYNFLLAGEETDDIVRSDELYYYIDDTAEKTRYLYLDSATCDGDIAWNTKQQTWVKNALKSTPDGYHIVVIAHIWADADYTVNPPAAGALGASANVMLGMFDAYNARTGEYSACTGKVEFCIGGHVHVDADYVSDGGIPVILTETESRSVRSGAGCTAGTITESSVSAIVANYAAGVVDVIRVGRGNSRRVSLDGSGVFEDYDLVAPTGNFTNVIKTATEADGKTIFNGGHGYKNDTRYATSSSAFVDAAGWDTTGYFPCKIGDVLRFHNVEYIDMNNTGGTNKRNRLSFFDSSYGYIGASEVVTLENKGTSAVEALQLVYGDNGDVIQLTIPAGYGSSVAYASLAAKNLTGASIITVNEEIVITG